MQAESCAPLPLQQQPPAKSAPKAKERHALISTLTDKGGKLQYCCRRDTTSMMEYKYWKTYSGAVRPQVATFSSDGDENWIQMVCD